MEESLEEGWARKLSWVLVGDGNDDDLKHLVSLDFEMTNDNKIYNI